MGDCNSTVSPSEIQPTTLIAAVGEWDCTDCNSTVSPSEIQPTTLTAAVGEWDCTDCNSTVSHSEIQPTTLTAAVGEWDCTDYFEKKGNEGNPEQPHILWEEGSHDTYCP